MSTRPNRETAYRVFAAEFDDATFSYTESDEERAPNYVLTPTGARINRLFTVGVLTEIESVNDEQLRARIADPTGAFVVYAGQYQPEALSFLERAETPAFVAVTGKARTFQPEDSNRVFTSIRPETLSEVDAATRDRFIVDTAERTAERVRTMQDALACDERDDALREALEAEDVEVGLTAGIPRAIDHYGTTPAYLDAVREMALDAARVVAGERDEVSPLDVSPDEGDSTDRAVSERTDETDSRDEPTASATESMDESKSVTESVATDNSETAVETESALDSDGSSIEAESSVEAESANETDEPTTVEATTEPEQSDSGIEDESLEADTSGEEIGDTETDLEDPEEFELDEEVREQIEDTYGTDFESAAEIDEPGKADIETPTAEGTSTETGTESEPTEIADPSATESSGEIEPEASDVSTDETTETDTTEDTETTESTDDVNDDESETDPEAAVVAAMGELDDGDGADREAVIEQVAEDDGLTREEAEDGIQSALLSGECYEPEDDILKSI